MKKYDKYKDSGVEWIGQVPRHWETCRFKDFMKLQTDASMSENKIGLENIESKSGKFIETSTEFEGNGVAFTENDIVYGKLRPYLQKVWLAEFEGNAVGDFFVFKAKENSVPTFIKYLLLSDGFTKEADGSTVGAKMPRVSSNFILTMHYCLPPLSEQDAIATYLDKKCSEIDKVISAQQKRIALLQELKQSVITHAVTKGLNPNVEMKKSGVEWIGEVPKHWEVRKIKQICKNEKYAIKTGPFGTQLKGQELQPEGDVVVYNQRNVIDNSFDKVQFYVTKEKAKSLSSFYTKPGDILVTSRGTIGRAAILAGKFPMGILHPCLIAIRLNENKCLQKWLMTYINETNCFKTDVTLSSNATTIDVVYTETLKNIAIPIPPLYEQRIISIYLDKKCASIDSSISKAQHQVELLQEYKQSLITEVVTGKRKVC